MPIRLLVLVLIGLVPLSGCRRGSAPAAAGPTPEPAAAWEAISVAARVLYDNGGGIQDSMRMVIRDAETLRIVWSQATSRQSDPPPLPLIDFSSEMLLLVSAGRMTPEDEIRVDSIAVRQERRPDGGNVRGLAAVVRVVEGCRRFQVDAYPLEIIRVRRVEGTVSFLERRQRPTDC
jgi:hypothetical protein